MSAEILIVGNFFPSVLEDLTKSFTVTQLKNGKELAACDDKILSKFEAMVSFGWAPAEIIDRLPNLKIISSFGVGYDGVAAEHAALKGIMVSHTPNVLNDDVANTAIILVLTTTRQIVAQDKYLREGRWEKEGPAPLTHSIADKTIGIVGLGRIGEAIAEKLVVFCSTIVYHSRNKKPGAELQYFGDLEEMAKACDVLIAITPGGSGTHHLIDKKVIDGLGPKGTLINVARGSVVDEKEMVLALREGRLGAAGLDVFEHEPKIPAELIAMENVVLLPHVASATWETRQAMSDLVVENLTEFFNNGAPSCPVPECAHLVKS